MSNEFDDLNLDVDQPEPTPKGRCGAVPTQLYMLMAVLLAGACTYLIWLYNEDQTAIQQLQGLIQKTQEQRGQLINSSKEVREALTELADHAANEAELHSSQGNRKQALADVEQARHLLGLAKKLTTCDCHTREMEPIDAKLTKLIDKLQPTQEETARLEPPTGTSSEPPGPPLEKKILQHQPEQSKVSGENNSGGESDA